MSKSLPVYQPKSIASEETMVVPVPSNLSELQSELVEKSKEILNLKEIIRIYESRYISVEENEKEHIVFIVNIYYYLLYRNLKHQLR